MYSTTRVLCSVGFFPFPFIITLKVLGKDFFHQHELHPYSRPLSDTHTEQITVVLVIKFDISIFIYFKCTTTIIQDYYDYA